MRHAALTFVSGIGEIGAVEMLDRPVIGYRARCLCGFECRRGSAEATEKALQHHLMINAPRPGWDGNGSPVSEVQ